LRKLLKPADSARVATCLPGLLNPAKRNHGMSPRFKPTHALPDIFFDLHLQMALQFMIERGLRF
jgi:hypothetical protein